MKHLIFLILGLMISLVSKSDLLAQSAAFNNFIIAASSKTNPQLEKGFVELGGYSRFANESWAVGKLVTIDGSIFDKDIKINYDFENNQLYVINKENESEIFQIDHSWLRRFEITDDKGIIHLFVKNKIIDSTSNIFYEIIGGKVNNIALLKSRKAKYRFPNKNDYLANASGKTITGSYKSLVYYYLIKSNQFQKLENINRKDLQAFLPDNKAEIIKAYKKKKILDESEAALLFNQINK